MQYSRKDQLGNPCAALDCELIGAKIRKNNVYLAAIVGIDGAWRVEHGHAVAQREPRAWPDLTLDSGRQRDGNTGRNHRPFARRDDHGRVGRYRSHQVEPGRVLALISRQRQVGAVRQPTHADLDFAHALAPASWSAMRATSARATSSFDCGGQDSTPLAVTRWTALRSPPMTPLSADTSLATIQSQPLRASLALA